MDIASIVFQKFSRLRYKEYPTSQLVLLASAASLYAWFIYQLLRTVGKIPIGPDAWSLIEIARSIQNRTFPQIETVRQFKIIDFVFSNITYPPLTPLLLSLHGSNGTWASAIAHQSIAIALALPAPLFFALRKNFDSVEAAVIALLTTIVTLSYAPYRQDVLAYGTMSLSVLLLGSAFAVLLSRKIGPKEAALVGLLLGLNCLNRTDGPFFAVIMLVAIICVSRFRVSTSLSYAGAVIVTLSPWLVFTKMHFGIFLISDNLNVARAVSDHILRVHGVPAQNIAQFLSSKVRNLFYFLIACTAAVYYTKALLVLAAAAAWGLLLSLRAHFFENVRLWIILVSTASVIGAAATGYFWETRYIAPLIVATTLVGSTALSEALHGLTYERYLSRFGQFACIVSVGLALIQISSQPWRSPFSRKAPDEIGRALHSLQPPEQVFLQFENNPHVFFAIDRSGPLDEYAEIFRIGALGTIHAIPQPYDWKELSPDEQRSFFNTLRVDLVAGACGYGQAPAFVLSLSGYQGCLYSPNEWLSRIHKRDAN